MYPFSICPRGALLAALLIAAAALLALGAPQAGAQTPIVPQEGGLYPLLTPLTGPCKPAAGTGESRQHSFSKFIWASDPDPLIEPDGSVWPYGVVSPGGEWRDAWDSAEPCTAAGTRNANPHGLAIRPTDAGDYLLFAYNERSRWLYDDQDCFCWVYFESQPLQRVFTRQFKVYDPCNYVVEAVTGRALITRHGKTQRVGRHSPVMRGDLLTVQPEGKQQGRVQLEGDVNRLGFGHGEYRFSDSKACEDFFRNGHAAAELPERPADVEVKKKGVIEQAIEDIGSIIRAGKELKVDGIFSNLVPNRGVQASAASVAPRFKLTRKKGATKVCAKKGRVRLRTTSKKVAKKRKLVIEAGQCAKAKDGKAPKRLGKKKRKR
jgi:hypothetical protein